MVANRDPNANNPHDRITLTLPAIARAGLVVFTVSGNIEVSSLPGVVAGPTSPPPGSPPSEVVWLVDADAVGDTPLPT